jgi:alanine dehydrogenase
MTILLSEKDIRSVLTIGDAMSALEHAYTLEADGTAAYRRKATVYVGSEHKGMTHVTSLGGLSDPPVVAINIRSMVQGQTSDRTGPGGTYMIMLFSGATGELLAIMTKGLISSYRTGGSAGLAAREMAQKDAEVVGILGTGSTAKGHALAYNAIRKVQLFKVYSRSAAHLDSFTNWLREQTGVPVKAHDNAEAVCRDSDIIAACTSSRFESHVKKDWLKPGVHMTGIQLGDGGQELEEDALPLFQRLVTSAEGPSTHHHTNPLNKHLETATNEEFWNKFRVIPHHHTLPEVLSGKAPGRANKQERNYFFTEGTGVQYAAMAAVTYKLAHAKGLGWKLPDAWVNEFRSMEGVYHNTADAAA